MAKRGGFPGGMGGFGGMNINSLMKEAKKIGNAKVFNIIVLGMAARHMDFSKEAWLDVIKKTVPPKTVEVNQKAFLSGYEC